MPGKDMNPLPQYVDVNQLSQALGVSVCTIYREIGRGRFPPPLKIGSASRWPVDVIRQVLEGNGADA